jgi:16S rRNA processing protein RimM
VNSREESIVLKNMYLRILRTQLKELGEDQFYISDLEGMDVYLQDGSRLGNLKEVIKTGANDVYSVVGEKKKFLIPAIKEIIKSVDIENKKIIIQPIEGLLDLEG